MNHESDEFERELRVMLRDATAGLEPYRSVDQLAHTAPTVAAPSRAWARAGAVGLTAAAVAGVVVWAGHDGTHDALVPSSTSNTSPVAPGTQGTPSTAAVASTTEAPLPAAEFEPFNLLVVGLDRAVDCIDPDSPYAASLPPESAGARSDTIMVLRLDPAAATVSVLSFPRDLWVPIAGRSSSNRLNSAVVENDPTRLLGTIYNEFGIEVDHFVQVDFCSTKTLVDGLGGVEVPFAAPARDTHTGLSITQPGCVRLDGDQALAYLRSRHYEMQAPDGTWTADPASDLGRISRQQDFLGRLLAQWRADGLTDVDAVRALITAMQESVVIDSGLTINAMLDVAGFLAALDASSVRSFTIEATGANIAGNSVLIPELDGENMRATLALFRGETMHTTTGVVEPSTSVADVAPAPSVTC
ncbi:MAG: LCP family protein [Acidimicrobiales bacterium]